MKIAIVGTSNLTEHEKLNALAQIETILYHKTDPNNDEIITGDANGIDSCVTSFADKIKITVIKALDKSWGGQHGFKNRNIMIAEKADYVYSMSTKVKKERCYHCDIPNHERTGGCWTMRFAIDKLKKKGELIII